MSWLLNLNKLTSLETSLLLMIEYFYLRVLAYYLEILKSSTFDTISLLNLLALTFSLTLLRSVKLFRMVWNI